jgi:putative endonuclease
MYYVYMLLCGDDTIYTGITTDVERRVQQHRSGKGARYTRSRGAKRLLYTERKRSRSTASKREAEIKKMTRNEKLALVATSKK